jgi:hypothetical protein
LEGIMVRLKVACSNDDDVLPPSLKFLSYISPWTRGSGCSSPCQRDFSL